MAGEPSLRKEIEGTPKRLSTGRRLIAVATGIGLRASGLESMNILFLYVGLMITNDGHEFFPFWTLRAPPAPQPVVLGSHSVWEGLQKPNGLPVVVIEHGAEHVLRSGERAHLQVAVRHSTN